MDLPLWWLSWPDVGRLLAEVESELGVRFPDRPPTPRLRRGESRW